MVYLQNTEIVDESMNQFYFIFCKVKQNYDTLMTPHNVDIINNNSIKNKFIDMGFEVKDAECMTLSFMFFIFVSMNKIFN
jgi:hypothetical protein